MNEPTPESGPAASGGPAPGDPSLVEEVRLGSSEASRAVNLALLALTRTARSFQLYDARNESIRQFLADLRTKLLAALSQSGPLELEVRPFELAWNREVVYLERDRERSLAFRLFRDGVRRLRIAPQIAWEEILSLLEVLSVRYSGVRQQEDDMVTLLSKQAFAHVSFDAVEGFVPEEDLPDDLPAAHADVHVDAPSDWDLPAPPAAEPVPLAFRPLPAEAFLRLRAEEAPENLADACVALADALLVLVANPTDPLELEEIGPFLGEVRDFLLGAGLVPQLLTLAAGVEHVTAQEFGPTPAIFAAFGSPAAIRRLLHCPHPDDGDPDFVAYFQAVPGNHLKTLIDLLEEDPDRTVRARASKAIEVLAEPQPESVLARLGSLSPATIVDILPAFAQARPDRAVDAAVAVKDHPAAEVQLQVIAVLVSLRYTPGIDRVLLGMLASPHDQVRIEILSRVAGHHDPRTLDALVQWAEEHAPRDLSLIVADALGRALAEVAPTAAPPILQAWLQPKGLLTTAGQRALQWAAVAGLAHLPGEEPEKLVRSLFEKSGGELHRHCLSHLVQRRRRLAARPGAGRG